MPLFLNLMKLLISQKLSLGYDVGRGYVAGEDEVKKLINHMVDHKEIAQTLKKISDHGRLDVIRCLGICTVKPVFRGHLSHKEKVAS